MPLTKQQQRQNEERVRLMREALARSLGDKRSVEVNQLIMQGTGAVFHAANQAGVLLDTLPQRGVDDLQGLLEDFVRAPQGEGQEMKATSLQKKLTSLFTSLTRQPGFVSVPTAGSGSGFSSTSAMVSAMATSQPEIENAHRDVQPSSSPTVGSMSLAYEVSPEAVALALQDASTSSRASSISPPPPPSSPRVRGMSESDLSDGEEEVLWDGDGKIVQYGAPLSSPVSNVLAVAKEPKLLADRNVKAGVKADQDQVFKFLSLSAEGQQGLQVEFDQRMATLMHEQGLDELAAFARARAYFTEKFRQAPLNGRAMIYDPRFVAAGGGDGVSAAVEAQRGSVKAEGEGCGEVYTSGSGNGVGNPAYRAELLVRLAGIASDSYDNGAAPPPAPGLR